MRRRLSFDDYLGMVLFALVCTACLFASAVLLGPQIPACFCGVNLPTRYPGWGCCRPLPKPWFIQALPTVFIVVLAMSLLVAVTGIVLGRLRRPTIDVSLVYALELSPLLTLVFFAVVSSFAIVYPYLFLKP